jgi:hypothetical protein
VPYGDVEKAIREGAQAIFEEAPRGHDGDDEMALEIAGMEELVSEFSEQAQVIADELMRGRSETLRTKLRTAEDELNATREALRDLRARRDTFAGPYVLKRLEDLRDALHRDPFSVAEANKTLKQAVRSIALNPTGSLTIHWRHSDIETDIPFWSKRGGFGKA